MTRKMTTGTQDPQRVIKAESALLSLWSTNKQANKQTTNTNKMTTGTQDPQRVIKAESALLSL